MVVFETESDLIYLKIPLVFLFAYFVDIPASLFALVLNSSLPIHSVHRFLTVLAFSPVQCCKRRLCT